VIEAMAKILKGSPASPLFRPIREIIITYFCLLVRFCFGIVDVFPLHELVSGHREEYSSIETRNC
jgi:hypothetical protein